MRSTSPPSAELLVDGDDIESLQPNTFADELRRTDDVIDMAIATASPPVSLASDNDDGGGGGDGGDDDDAGNHGMLSTIHEADRTSAPSHRHRSNTMPFELMPPPFLVPTSTTTTAAEAMLASTAGATTTIASQSEAHAAATGGAASGGGGGGGGGTASGVGVIGASTAPTAASALRSAAASSSGNTATTTTLDALPMVSVFLEQHERIVQVLLEPLSAVALATKEENDEAEEEREGLSEYDMKQLASLPAFGLLRTKLLSTVQAMLIRILIVPDASRASYVARLANTRILDACFDIFFAYKWHSIVHTIIEDMVAGMVMLQYPGSEQVQAVLLNRVRLHHRILAACQLNARVCATSPHGAGARLGFMAHTLAMAESLTSNTRLATLMLQDASFSRQSWQAIVVPLVVEAKKLRTAARLARLQQQQLQQQQLQRLQQQGNTPSG